MVRAPIAETNPVTFGGADELQHSRDKALFDFGIK